MFYYKRIDVSRADEINRLYDEGAVTIGNVSEEEFPGLVAWLHTEIGFARKIPNLYIASGKLMNQVGRLNGDPLEEDKVCVIIKKSSLAKFANVHA